MEPTFRCDQFGRELPRSQMKELFDESGTKLELCPEDLEEKMNAAGAVRGGPGEEKQAAAYSEDAPQEGPYGQRVAPGN